MPKTAEEIVNIVTNKGNEAGEKELCTRIDTDFEEWELTKSEASKSMVKAPELRDNDIEIIANDVRTFCDHVQSTLVSADRMIRVSMAERGEDMRDEIGKLETIFSYALQRADERLSRLIQPPLKDQLVWYGILQGSRNARVLVYKKSNNVIFDITPLNRRWLKYGVGPEGLLWVSYETFRTKERLESEYDVKAKSDTQNKVIDWWECDYSKGEIHNSTVYETKFTKEPDKQNLKSMPFVILPIATRPQIVTESGNKESGYGESILAPNREITRLLNQLYTIWASHANVLAHLPQLNYMDDQGIELHSTISSVDTIINLPMGHNKLESPDIKDISPTLMELIGLLNMQRQKGALPDVEYGDLRNIPLSGTAINELKQARNKIFGLQVRNLNEVYSNILRLIEEQLLTGKLRMDIKTSVRNKYYETKVTPVDLKRPHIINVEFVARTPWEQLETAQLADMLKRQGIPDAFLWEKVFKFDDPKRMYTDKAIELYENSPKGAMVAALKGLIEDGRIEEAKQLVADLHQAEMAEQGEGVPTAPEGEPTGEPSLTPPMPPLGI